MHDIILKENIKNNISICIVGDGIAALLLAWQLRHIGNTTIYGNGATQIASIYGAAVINPLANAKYKIVDNFNAKYAIALNLYTDISNTLGNNYIAHYPIIKFQPEVAKNEFIYNCSITENSEINSYFKLKETFIKINKSLKIDTKIIDDLRKYFAEHHTYINTTINTDEKQTLQDLSKQYNIIILCEGSNAYTKKIYQPYKLTKNRGNILIANIPQLGNNYIYDFNCKIVPLKNQFFWIGSNNEWNYTNLEPNNDWRYEITTYLTRKLNLDIEVRHHYAIERPTIAGQIPITSKLEAFDNIWICNGLGTRGYSNGPFITQKLAESIKKYIENKHL